MLIKYLGNFRQNLMKLRENFMSKFEKKDFTSTFRNIPLRTHFLRQRFFPIVVSSFKKVMTNSK